jgi:membrane protease YdiL (CAAX protease family)
VTVVLIAAGIPFQTAPGRLSLTFVALLSFLDTALLLTLIVVLLRRRLESPRAVFLNDRSFAREAALGLALLPLIFVGASLVIYGIRELAPWMRSPGGNPLEALLETPRDAAVFAVVAVTAGGIREEVQRAFVLRRFQQYLGGGVTGLIVFSVAFGLGHALQGWDAAVTTGLLGLAWGTLYLTRGSIVAAVVSHSGFNLAEVIRAAMLR